MGKRKSIIVICIAFVILAVLVIVGIVWKKRAVPVSEETVMSTESESYDYNCKDAIDTAMDSYKNNRMACDAISDIATLDREISLNFEGNTDEETMKKILDILDEHDIKATFFIPAIDIAESDPGMLKEILERGNDIQNYTLNANPHMEKKDAADVISELCRSQAIYTRYCGYEPTVLKFNATALNKDLLEQAGACRFAGVVDCNSYLNYASFSNEQAAKDYVARINSGAIYSIKLEGYLDEVEVPADTEEMVTDDTEEKDPAKDKQADLDLSDTQTLTQQQRLLNVVEWVAEAIDENKIDTVLVKELPDHDIDYLGALYKELQKRNDGQLADACTFAYTTDREASFIFRGIGNTKGVDNVLGTLSDLGISGTFFVTAKELEENQQEVQKIIDAGFQVENGGYSGIYLGDADFNTACNEIYLGQEVFEKYGIESNYYMSYSSNVSDAAKEAASALGVTLISYNMDPLKAEYLEKGYKAEQIVDTYFGSARNVLCRGDIVYVDMERSDAPELAADVVRRVYAKKVAPTQYRGSILKMCSISDLFDSTWGYPANVSETDNRIKLSNHAVADLNVLMQNNYIGNRNVDLLNFTDQELQTLDKIGRVNTGGSNTVFLTFDDWGDEASIGKLLYVLNKHNVKATFFVKTQYVSDSTMNLLRAMAADGHDVASHTNTHMTVDIPDSSQGLLQQDLVKSNQVLSSVVGDTGRLTNYFRPPTLAINALGMKTIYSCGYHYIISGDVSTKDYEAGSAQELFDVLREGSLNDDGSRNTVGDGSILVMHMSDTAKYTAEAVDMYLSYQESLPDGDPNKHNFARLSDYLGN